MKRAARVCMAAACVVFTFAVFARGQGSSEELLCKECSRYSFHSFGSSDGTDYWNKPVILCKKKHGAELASMESEMEWKVVRNFVIKNQTLRKPTAWYIGLRKDEQLNQWCWQSNNKTCINSSGKGTWRWQNTEPTGDGSCVEMARNYPPGYFGRYNDLPCDVRYARIGYMCEKKVDCSDNFSSNGYLLQWNISCQSTVQPSLKTEAPKTVVTTQPVTVESLATTEPKNKGRYTGAVPSETVPGSQAQSTDISEHNSGPTKASTLHSRCSFYEQKTIKESVSSVLVISLSVVFLLVISMMIGVMVFLLRKRNSGQKYQGRCYHVDSCHDHENLPTSARCTKCSPQECVLREDEETYENTTFMTSAKEKNKDPTNSVINRASMNSRHAYDNIPTNKQVPDVFAESSVYLGLGERLEMHEYSALGSNLENP